jgi:predicted Fe-Mo cluster-binding NifX family protein
MKICIPSEHDRGFESLTYPHFGSAPYFIIYDTETRALRTLRNADEHHTHGACHPLKALTGESVEAVIVGGIGARAIAGLNAAGVKVYRSVPGTVAENLDRLEKGRLGELTADQACTHERHGCD